MKIAIAQVNTISGDIKHNVSVIKQYALDAFNQKADIVVFPELALPGGFAKDLYLRKDFLSLCDAQLKELVKELKIPVLLGTVYDDENAAVYIKDNKMLQVASKINAYEDLRYFKNNDINISFDGFSSCIYSNKENLDISANAAKKNKNEILFILANDVFYMGRIEEVYKELKDCALKHQINIVFVNMVGGQDGIISYGGSVAISKTGNTVSKASAFEESLTIVDFLKSKEDIFEEISYEKQAYDALVLGLKDYAKKNDFKKIVLGVSGGVDSALVTVIAKDALGSENVTGVFMPSGFTSNQSKEDAELLCRLNGIKLLTVPINSIFDTFKSSLKDIFSGKDEDVTEENLQSRIRGMLLMAYSNKFNALLVNSSNKSESATGYCTIYGDSIGGYSVVCDLPKTFLYKICNYRNSLIDSIPKSILEREPTAELRHDQKDSDSLPVYEELDGIIIKYLNSFSANLKGSVELSKKEKEIFRLIDKAEYKRQQCPLGTKISKWSFVRDIKIPVTNGYKE